MKKFTVWAPEKEEMILHIVSPFDREIHMSKDDWGYFSTEIDLQAPTVKYYYRPAGEKDLPDPASAFQPEGVHGPSETVDHSRFRWTDQQWKGLPFNELVLYEIHIGTFTPEGTFDAAITRLDDLKRSGINAVEIMPVSQFPGDRNWGYDGAYPYAVQNSYGGPDGFKRLVNACHENGIAVFLDVVYNHLGPEGNYFGSFGPYFTKKYTTPWGDAINFDGDWSDGVRDFFADNIVYWFEHYHIDGLRCDAIHAMFDNGAMNFWELVKQKVNAFEEKAGRKFFLVAESDLNSPKVVKDSANGGYGFDAQWLDDFHHALYKMLNPSDRERYYDFGKIEQLAKAFTDGFVHSGEWVKFRKRKHGMSSAGVSGEKFVAFNLNHDQAGNRAGGERLCMLVGTEQVKVAAAALLLAPYVPMLFMGEEYADDTPFFYFVSHGDEALIKAVREGRREEFESFGFDDSVPDPQSEDTFRRSKIHWEKRNSGPHKKIREWHERLIQMRREFASLKNFDKKSVEVRIINASSMAVIRKNETGSERLLCVFNFSEENAFWNIPDDIKNGDKVIDSYDAKWSEDERERYRSPDHISARQAITLPPVSVSVYSC